MSASVRKIPVDSMFIDGYPIIDINIRFEDFHYYKILKKTRLLKGYHQFDIYEYRILNYLLAMTLDERTKTPITSQAFYRINLRFLAEASSQTNKRSGTFVSRYKKASLGLDEKRCFVKGSLSDDWQDEFLLSRRYFQSSAIFTNDDYVAFQFSEYFVKMVNMSEGDNEGYSLTNLSSYFKESSINVLRLVEFVSDILGYAQKNPQKDADKKPKKNKDQVAKREYSIEEIKGVFGATKYSNSDFLKKILLRAIDDVNEKKILGDFRVSVLAVNEFTKKKISKIVFIVSNKKPPKPESELDNGKPESESDDAKPESESDDAKPESESDDAKPESNPEYDDLDDGMFENKYPKDVIKKFTKDSIEAMVKRFDAKNGLGSWEKN